MKDGVVILSLTAYHILQIKFMNPLCYIAFSRLAQNTVDDMSASVQVMVWCRQAQLFIRC